MTGTVRIEGGAVVFELHGIDAILRIKRTIKVPLEHIMSVSTEHVTLNPRMQMRLVGARLPRARKSITIAC